MIVDICVGDEAIHLEVKPKEKKDYGDLFSAIELTFVAANGPDSMHNLSIALERLKEAYEAVR